MIQLIFNWMHLKNPVHSLKINMPGYSRISWKNNTSQNIKIDGYEYELNYWLCNEVLLEHFSKLPEIRCVIDDGDDDDVDDVDEQNDYDYGAAAAADDDDDGHDCDGCGYAYDGHIVMIHADWSVR